MIKHAIEEKIEVLYHYQKFNFEYLSDLLLKNRIKFSDPKSFNDPWDCKAWFSHSFLKNIDSYKKVVSYILKIQKRQLNLSGDELQNRASFLMNNPEFVKQRTIEISKAMTDTINSEYKVYCLSLEENNPLMWAHYSNSHKGLCLGFKVDSNVFCGAMKVDYRDTYPEVSVDEEDGFRLICDLLLTKSSQWQYEQEYRLIGKENNQEALLNLTDGYAYFDKADLVKIIVGCSMTPENIAKLKKLLIERKSTVSLYQALPVEDRYSLELKKLN